MSARVEGESGPELMIDPQQRGYVWPRLPERIVEMAVVHPGDKVIVKVPGDMPIDPYSSVPAPEQLLGESVGVVVLQGSLEITVLRTGAS